MANKHANLDALFTDIANAIREKTGESGTIAAAQLPSVIRSSLQVIPPVSDTPDAFMMYEVTIAEVEACDCDGNALSLNQEDTISLYMDDPWYIDDIPVAVSAEMAELSDTMFEILN